jgi:MFS transporter, YNFM family, putative membrane transport protein
MTANPALRALTPLAAVPAAAARHLPAATARLRPLMIGTIAFLTVVDLFATQAILPSLAAHYAVSAAAMSAAVNASTLGMAVAGLLVAFFGSRLDRRRGIVTSLALLVVPTTLLALAPDLATFSALRVAQGLCMAAAFSLTLAYLGEQCSARAVAGAFAAYVTGNVASNLLGRMLAAAAVDHVGLAGNFYLFALLNLAGALLAWLTLRGGQPQPQASAAGIAPADRLAHFRNRALLAGFGIGFLILFAFIGAFTFVNFVLVREPLVLSSMTLGLVYLVFLPSIVTTPLAGRAVARLGVRTALVAALGVAALGLPLVLAPDLPTIMLGLALIGIGTFFAQATATGFVSRAATTDRAAASGIYLASYFSGGLAGTVVLGQVFDHFGWAACVGGIGLALAVAALLARHLRLPAVAIAT